jgi:hypothetical protein
MNQTPKFPDMRPATPPGPINLPPPSGYVQRVPLFPTTDGSVTSRRFERKRLWLWFGIAVAFHAVLLLGLWLMPALRIKWEPSPDAWVQVTSIPSVPSVPTPPTVPIAQPASPTDKPAAASKAATGRERTHKAGPVAQRAPEQDLSAAP